MDTPAVLSPNTNGIPLLLRGIRMEFPYCCEEYERNSLIVARNTNEIPLLLRGIRTEFPYCCEEYE
jgi:hypothetical protein